jgi:putative membrane protein
MSSLFIKRVGLSMALGLASVHAMAASSDDFVDAATEAGIAEVVTGNLAKEKSQNADIKEFAQQMVTDHTQANQKLGDIARKLDISVPDEAALTDKVKKMILEWREESFDKSYINNQVDAHEKAVELFKKEAASSDKAELKAFASDTLPKLKQHLEHAKALQAKHGK